MSFLRPNLEKSKTNKESAFLRACRREATDLTPVWLMRQAGRYMKEYRDLRRKVSFLELCKDKDLCAEVTVHAQERIGADAAIIFSDLLLVLEPMGMRLDYPEKGGPVITGNSVTREWILRLPDFDLSEKLSFVMDAIQLTRRSLKPGIPLIGFCGAPFTIAAYILEGGSSKTFSKTKAFMRSEPVLWGQLLEKVSKILTYFKQCSVFLFSYQDMKARQAF